MRWQDAHAQHTVSLRKSGAISAPMMRSRVDRTMRFPLIDARIHETRAVIRTSSGKIVEARPSTDSSSVDLTPPTVRLQPAPNR